MDSTIIKNHNNRVKPQDTVFYLGDFCFRNTKGGKKGEGVQHKADYYLQQLNGRFVFIKGNHDHNNSLKTPIHSIVLEMGGKFIYLVHRPVDYEPSFKINFVAHVHHNWVFQKKDNGTQLINVGCDMWKFKPIDYNEIMKALAKLSKGKITVKGKPKRR